jgi:hypothetical protein
MVVPILVFLQVTWKMKRQFKSEVHQRLIYLNRILQMVFYSQATFSVYC